MHNHFACIGFSTDVKKALSDAITMGNEKVEVFGADGCPYYIRMWSPVTGAEVWTQHLIVPEAREIRLIACDPHFTGTSRVRVGIVAITTSDNNPCEAIVTGWAAPSDEKDPESGCYPFNFYCPDFLTVRDNLRTGVTATFQVAAFADDLKCFLSEGQYDELEAPVVYHPDGEPAFISSESFFPGSTISNDDGVDVPNPRVFFTGKINSVETIRNIECGGSFYHLLVETYGGSYDVVACPEVVDGVPVVDGIIQGNFWLSGRMIDG